jgi:hypothetical protein
MHSFFSVAFPNQYLSQLLLMCKTNRKLTIKQKSK